VQPIPAFRVCSHTHTRLPKTQKDRDLDRWGKLTRLAMNEPKKQSIRLGFYHTVGVPTTEFELVRTQEKSWWILRVLCVEITFLQILLSESGCPEKSNRTRWTKKGILRSERQLCEMQLLYCTR
jgi:hypothetical protein